MSPAPRPAPGGGDRAPDMASTIPAILLFDGRCAASLRRAEHLRSRSEGRLEVRPFQHSDPSIYGLDEAQLELGAHLVLPPTPDLPGETRVGGEPRVLRGLEAWLAAGALDGDAPVSQRVLALAHRRVPGAAALLEAIYRWGVRHGRLLGRLQGRLGARTPAGSRFRHGHGIFPSALAALYLLGFLALLPQLLGLIGSEGIYPATRILEGARGYAEDVGRSPWRVLPSLAWWAGSDSQLVSIAWGGAGCAVLALLGWFQGPFLLACWVAWISLLAVGGSFLSNPGDMLLAELGFAALFFVPWKARARGEARPDPPGAARWILLFLLFRLQFGSGIAKFWAGEANLWLHLDAFHYLLANQATPTPVARLLLGLPMGVQIAVGSLILATEWVAPFFVFGPRRLRLLAASGIAAQHLLLFAVGGDLLLHGGALILVLLLLDDEVLRHLPLRAGSPAPRRPARLRWALAPVFAAFLFACGSLRLVHGVGRLVERPAWADCGEDFFSHVDPWRVSAGYAVWARVPEVRLELQIEGSDDGERWASFATPYARPEEERAWRWRNLTDTRLDDALSRAAHEGLRATPWFDGFLEALLRGRPPVLGLFEETPYPSEDPPQGVRALLVLVEVPGATAQGLRSATEFFGGSDEPTADPSARNPESTPKAPGPWRRRVLGSFRGAAELRASVGSEPVQTAKRQ